MMGIYLDYYIGSYVGSYVGSYEISCIDFPNKTFFRQKM